MNPEKTEVKPDKPIEKYFYFLDGQKIETANSAVTGSILRSMLPEEKRGYTIMMEGHGTEPDQQITDDSSITLDKDKGPRRFYSVPPATFG